MALYLLHTGRHIGDWTDPKSGVVDRNHVYGPGEFVSDDKTDLAASFPEKFSYPGQRPGVGNVPNTPETLDAQIEELKRQKDAMLKEKAKGEAALKAAQAGGNAQANKKAIDDMTPQELAAFAEEEEIDLKGFKPKHPGDPKKAHEERVAFVKSQVG